MELQVARCLGNENFGKTFLESFASGNIETNDFFLLYPEKIGDKAECIVDAIKYFFETKNAIGFEKALSMSFSFPLLPRVAPILCSAIVDDWHKRHIDCILALEELKYVPCIDNIYKAALMHFLYLDYDDSYSFQCHCVWALFRIGTTEARDKLVLLTKAENEIVRNEAIERLSKWK